MRKWISIAAIFLNLIRAAHADTPPGRDLHAWAFDSVGNGITSTPSLILYPGHTGLDVNILNQSTLPANQGLPTTIGNAWPFYLTNSLGTVAAGVTNAGALKVDGSAVTQPVSGLVSIGNFPATLGVTQSTSPWVVSGSVAVNNFPLSFIVNQGTNPWTVTGSVSISSISGIVGVTQSTSPWVVSGTVTSNIGTTGGLALDSSLTPIANSVNSINTKLGSLGQKNMAGSAPVVIASDQSALTVTGSLGRTWMLSSATDSVSISNFPGTLAVTQSTSPWVVSGTVTANIGTTGGLALDSSLTPIANSVNSINTKLGSLGQKNMAGSAPVVIASDQSAVPISATSLPLPTDAATSANQLTEISDLGTINTSLGTINSTLGSPFQAGGSIGNTSFIATQTSGANLHVDVDSTPSIPSGSNPIGYLSGRGVVSTFTQNYSTNLSTSAFTTIITSTAATINEIDIWDNSGLDYYLAYASTCGALSTASNAIIISPGGGGKDFQIPSGNCVGFEAKTSNITSGYVNMTFYQ
jgi:hypothetical protein